MTLFSRLARRDDDAAERFHRALLLPDAICSDEQTVAMLEVSQMLAPGMTLSERARARGRSAMLAAFAAQNNPQGHAQAPCDEVDQASFSSVTHVVDTGGLGMVTLADLEPISAERAAIAAKEIAGLLASVEERRR